MPKKEKERKSKEWNRTINQTTVDTCTTNNDDSNSVDTSTLNALLWQDHLGTFGAWPDKNNQTNQKENSLDCSCCVAFITRKQMSNNNTKGKSTT